MNGAFASLDLQFAVCRMFVFLVGSGMLFEFARRFAVSFCFKYKKYEKSEDFRSFFTGPAKRH